MPNSTVFCCVQGLTSPKGQKVNGLACEYDPATVNPRTSSDRRLTVTIDGKTLQLSIKPENLCFFDKPGTDLMVAVGRESLRSNKFMATVVDQKQGQRANAQRLENSGKDCMRSWGSLKILLDYLDTIGLRAQQNGGGKTTTAVIGTTDLNIALLLNYYAVHKVKDKKLDSRLQPLAEKIGDHLIAHHRAGGQQVLFKYNPLRIHRRDRPAELRLQAVLQAKFHIYPCPHEDYLDSLEVRFGGPGRSTHEYFLDYGEEETLQYARNVHAMKELERLTPGALADIDPQMFWSGVLHSRELAKELQKLGCEELSREWSNIQSCVSKSISDFKENVWAADEAIRLLPDQNGRWNLINAKIHTTVATRNALMAIVMSVKWAADELSKAGSSALKIELMDNYIGTEIDGAVARLNKAIASGDADDLEMALHEFMIWKETKTCDHCGKKSKEMKTCSRCQGASYCGAECQRAAWPSHKKVCKELKRSNDAKESVPEKKPNMTVRGYTPGEVQEGCFFESTGLGCSRIMWYPSIPMRMFTFKAMKNETIMKTEMNGMGGLHGGSLDLAGFIAMVVADSDMVTRFKQDLMDLEPKDRLCLACGPIPHFDIARMSVDDALAQVQGNVANLRMKGVGFSPLEWAAKKGHKEIVEWLLSDSRTKDLIKVGSPVGWACYAGKVEIARLLTTNGAAADATDEIFWNKRPPILAAAEDGKLESVKFLVEECGISLKTKWRGFGILDHVEMSPGWRDMKGQRDVQKYAKRKLQQQKKQR